MTSLQIAEVTGKRHSDVMRSIRNQEIAWENVTERKFTLSEYTDATGRVLPCYELTKTECLYIATKFNDEARARLILRWEELETERISTTNNALPTISPFSNDDPVSIMGELEMRIKAVEDFCSVANIINLTQMIMDNTYTATEMAERYGLDVRHFNTLLKNAGVQYKGNDGKWRITEEYRGDGIIRNTIIIFPGGKGYSYMKWTRHAIPMLDRVMRDCYGIEPLK